MPTDTELKIAGIRALVAALGTVEAERFVALILREPFDYTQWQQSLWADQSLEQLHQAAVELRQTNPL